MGLKNFKTKQTIYIATFMVVVLCLTIFINLIFNRFHLNIDLTRRKLFTLTSESLDILKKVQNPINITYISRTSEMPITPININIILQQYHQANSSITVNTINPDIHPELLQQYNNKEKPLKNNSIIVSSKSLFKILYYRDLFFFREKHNNSIKVEELITNAIIYVMDGNKPVITFLKGHNEISPQDNGFSKLLEGRNFRLQKIDLNQQREALKNSNIIVEYLPMYDISTEEAQTILSFLKDRHGALYLILDYQFDNYTQWENILQYFNTKIDNGIVLEHDPKWLLPNYPTYNVFMTNIKESKHPILAPLIANGLNPYFMNTMGLEQTDIKKINLHFEPLLKTSQKSFLHYNKDEIRKTVADSSDIIGPITVMSFS